jgi:hypothetical protein
MPDSSLKPIGHIYQNLNDEEGTVTFMSIDNEGEEIVPPTMDYSEAEQGFEKYAKQLAKTMQVILSPNNKLISERFRIEFL